MKMDHVKKAAAIHRNIMQEVENLIRPGLTLLDLDKQIKKRIIQCGGTPCFLGYNGYPNASCLSVNEVAVHGIPNDYALKDGDIIDIDFGVSIGGWNVDAGQSLYVGDPEDTPKLITDTKEMCLSMISIVKNGVSIADLADVGQRFADSKGLNVITQYCGHGIGKTIHEKPAIYSGYSESYSDVAREVIRGFYSNVTLKTGDMICIEPVCTLGKVQMFQHDDGWTESTVDGSNVAHHEHTILVTETGFEILC